MCGALHHTHVRIALFLENEEQLGKLVMDLLPVHNKSSERKFAAAAALKEFMAEALEKESPYVDPTKPGAFSLTHARRRCS